MKRSVLLGGIAAIVAAFVAGYVLALATAAHPAPGATKPTPTAAQTVYTCSMHPQVRLNAPGNCPICEMPLVPLDPAGAPDAVAPRLTLSAHARRMASVETTAVERRELGRKLRAVGKIRYNEPALATVTARVDGYAERLFVGVTGVEIRAGDHLVEIYSPELAVAEQELLNAIAGGGAATLVNTGRLKLRRLGLTDAQVDALVRTRTAEDRVTLLSPIDGTVIEKSVVQNGSFKAGDVLYRVANLDSV
jgi:Cu(I)/Ag(I) efflux system membrane fusion protein